MIRKFCDILRACLYNCICSPPPLCFFLLLFSLVTILKQSNGAREAEKDQAAAQTLHVSLNEADRRLGNSIESVSVPIKYIIFLVGNHSSLLPNFPEKLSSLVVRT